MTNAAPADDWPVNPQVNDVYVNPEDKLFYFWDGTAWRSYVPPPEFPDEDPPPIFLMKGR